MKPNYNHKYPRGKTPSKKARDGKLTFKPDREEINRQVEAYLSSGGRITSVVLDDAFIISDDMGETEYE